MRFFLLLSVIASAVLFAPCTALAESTRSVELHARVVDFYSNRYILTADGNVSARMSDGTVVRGDTFTMDLKLNRFLIAGNVRLDGPHVHETGAAFAGFPDLERNYFLTGGPTPDRWTYFGLDFTDAHKGRVQPGDAFYFPDLTDSKPYIIANGAIIFLKSSVEFPIGSRIAVLGVYAPTPGFVVNFSANSNFYQNAFAGAVFDVGVPFHGAADAISALHFRYDQMRGLYTAFDQHFVHDRDYLAFSINPLTQNQRQFNLIAYKRISPASEARLFYQLSALSQGFNQPMTASDYVNFTFNTKVGRYAFGLNADQYNDSLLPNAQDAFSPVNGLRQAGHPFDQTLSIQSYEDEFRAFRYLGVPLKFQYRGGFGYNYDGYGIETLEGPAFGGVQYNTIYQKFLGLTVYTSSVKIAKQTTISAKADELEQWFSLPHHTTTTDVSATIARTPLSIKQPAYLLSYDILNIGDNYGAAQHLAYPASPNDPYVGPYGTFTGLSAFDGFATSHVLSGSMVYTPTPYFALNLTMQQYTVFPRPVPGLGGQPPYQFTADVRLRISQHILLDVTRTYYFNFGGEKWAPQFGIQFSP